MVVGIIALIVGILFLLKEYIPNFNINWNILWPSVLILIGVYNMIKEKKVTSFNAVISFIGLWYLLNTINLLPANINNIFWPLILIILGITLIINNSKRRRR